ncbi:hypothetical protein AgCh_012638 [Apium graveolens]
MGNSRAVRFLKELIQKHKPILVFLSETLVKRNKIEAVCKTIHFAGSFSIDAQGHGGGLALLWKNTGAVEIKDSCNHYIDFEVVCNQLGRWRYTGFYGCPERGRRQESWDLIRDLESRSALPWCILGDFNDMLFEFEKVGGRPQPRYLLEGFHATISDCGLQDLGFTGCQYTWERFRGTPAWIQERLDRGLANQQWRQLFPNAVIQVLEVSTSDHLPLLLQLNRQIYVPKTRRFRFENVWIRDVECMNLVQESWTTNGIGNILEKIEFCRMKLDEWGGGTLKELSQKIKHSRWVMRKFRSRRDTLGVQTYNDARCEFLKLLERQEIYWKQRSKQFWLREGDQNTRFFHKFASGRKKNNQIVRLKNKDGEWVDCMHGIQEIITEYFTDLFKSSGTGGHLSANEKVSCVTDLQNTQLMAPISDDEVKNAVFSMHAEKAPGYDGLNPCFYQAYWSVVGKDVVDFCQKFHTTGELLPEVNRTLVCLIPKVKQPQQMTELRPISLCNVLFRILSKVLANRLKICLPTLISPNQSAFIEGRLLTDNALIAFEVNHYIKRRTQGKTGVAGLKIDVSKAYDRLEWNFIEGMLRKVGFHEVWIERVMICIKTVSYSFIQQGTVFGEVQPQRGIRQGDPISPYLYILCAEGLSSIIKRNEEVGLLHGCSIARRAPSVSHLLFADDCYFFFRAVEAEARVMQRIIKRYENLSGQAVNFNKSTITFSPNTATDTREAICGLLEVRESTSPGKYLGIPMTIGRKKCEVFKFLTDRVRQKVQNWQNTSLSKAGKNILLKTAAQSIPNFWMNLLLIPGEICTVIQRQMNSYWWSNGNNNKGVRWMAWDKLCNVKQAGGLGFKKLQQFNIAMLAKQGWRLVNNSNPLVTNIMKAKYYPSTDFVNAKLGENPSYMWRSIVAAQEVINHGCRRSIGTGMDTYVWKVPWLPATDNGYLTTAMPPELENIKVCDLMDVQERKWDDEILNDLFNERDVQLIQQIPLSSRDIKDNWMWILDGKGEFSVKSCYRRLVGECSTLDASFWKKLWNLELPGKIHLFLWRTLRLCLPTNTALLEKKVNIDGQCSWCHVANETEKHILFECQFAREVWESSGMAQWVKTMPGETIFDMFKRLFNSGPKEQHVHLALLCWSLWNRPNKWVWDRVAASVFGTTSAAFSLLASWKEAQLERVRSSTATVGHNIQRWQAPDQHWVKINIDAATFMELGTVGIGGVIRDERGSFVRAMCKQIRGNWTPREAEAISLKEALSWVKQYGFRRCVFETDSKLLADAVNGDTGRSYFHSIVGDCVALFKHFENVLVRFVPRSANGVAHLLARVSRSMSDSQEWEDVAPNLLFDVLSFDLN